MKTRTGFVFNLIEYQPGMIESIADPESLIYCSTEGAEQLPDPGAALKRFAQEARMNNRVLILQISKQLLKMSGFEEMEELVYGLETDFLHYDSSFSTEEQKELASKIPSVISLNGISSSDRIWFRRNCPALYFFHDAYARKNTGLDRKVFEEMNEGIPSEQPIVQIPGRSLGRRTGSEKSTLEAHRSQTTYAAVVDLINQDTGVVLFTNPEIGKQEKRMIDDACQGIFCLPSSLRDESLYDQTFTIRIDSPGSLKRLNEKPEHLNGSVIPDIPVARKPGMITMDNANYPRTEGDLMICNGDLDADSGVNVLGFICDYYLPLLDLIQNGSRISFIRPSRT